MKKIALWILVLSFIALSCAPGSQTIPAGPATPASQRQEAQPSATPISQTTSVPATTPSSTTKGEQTVTFREQALVSAKSIVEQDSTFRFDGIKESLKLAGEKALTDGTSWEFTYTFDSRNPGYGDRTGKVMAQVITPHNARIVVKGGAVTEAVIDEQWDMLGRKMIEKKGY